MAEDRQQGTWFRTRYQARSQFRPTSFSLPFKTVTPSQLATPSFSSSYPSTPSARVLTHDILGKAGRTVREHDKEIDALRKENFSLKLRIYLLEQKFSEAVGRDVADTVQANVQLHIQLETLQKEIKCKERSLEETIKIAKENETGYRRAKEKILSLQEEISNLKEELDSKEKFETPKGSVNSSEIFKEAFDMWSYQDQSASVRLSDEDLHEKVSNLQKELMIKELEIQQSSITIKQMQENIESLQLNSKKKSKVIQSLVYKMKDFADNDSRDMWLAVNEGVEAAKNKDINKVLHSVTKIKQRFCELVSMSSEDLFHETFNIADIKSLTAIKSKEIQEQEQTLRKQMQDALADETDILHYLNEIDLEVSPLKTSALKSREKNENDHLVIVADTTTDTLLHLSEFHTQHNASLKQLKHQLEVANSATQTYICANIMDDEAWNNMITRLGQADCVETLKEEILVLLMKLEQKEKDAKVLRDEIDNLQNQMQEVVSQKSLITAQVKMLQQHLGKLSVVMENLIQNKYRLSDSAFTPKMLEEASRFLDDTLQLSRRLSGNLMVFEQSCLSQFDSSILTSSFSDGIGRFSIPFTLSRQSHPVNETLLEEEHEISKRGKSINDLLLNENQVSENHCGEKSFYSSDFIKNYEICVAKTNNLSSDLGIGMIDSSGHLNPELSKNVCSENYSKSAGFPNHAIALDFFGADLLHGHQHQVSSDSDIWSEPDRNLSNQRVGIEMTAPARTPPRQRCKTVMQQVEGTDSSSDGVDLISTGNQPRHIRGLFQKTCSKSRNLKDQFEKQLQVIEFYQKKFENFEKIVEGLVTQLNDASLSKGLEDTTSLSEICAEIKNFKDVLNGAVLDIKAARDTSTYAKAQPFSEIVVQELKEYMDNILRTLDYKEENHVTADQAKDIAERALLELDVFKRQLISVCTVLVAGGDKQADTALAAMLPSTDCVPPKNDSMIIKNSGQSLNDLVSKQKTENIKLKQALSCVMQENQFLESEMNKMASLKNQAISVKPFITREIECQTDIGSYEQSKLRCESLECELETLRMRLRELETKCSKYDSILKDKTSISFENKELKKNIKLLENHVSELTSECTELKSKSSIKIENLERRLASAENNTKLLQAENAQCHDKLQHSEEIYQSMKIQLSDTHKKLEEMRTKCCHYEKLLQNPSPARETGDGFNIKKNNIEPIRNYSSEASKSNEIIKSLEIALQATKTKLRDVENQFESLQKCAFLLESNSYIRAASMDKNSANLVDKMKKFQELLHRAHVIRNFMCIVNSVIIRNLKKKLQLKEDEMKRMEFEMLCHQKNNNTIESMNSVLIDIGSEQSFSSPYKFGKHSQNFEADFSEINSFHESKFDTSESIDNISFGMNTEKGDAIENQSLPDHQLQLENIRAQQEIKELKNKVQILLNKINERSCSKCEQERLLVAHGVQKEAPKYEKRKSEVVDSNAKLLDLRKENESLRQRVSDITVSFKDIEQERLMLYKQMKDKSDHIDKLNEEAKKAVEKANQFETLCTKHSGKIETLTVLVKNKNSRLEQLSDELKQKLAHVSELENVNRELYEKTQDFNNISLELKNSQDIANKLKTDLQCKIEEGDCLKKEIQKLRENLEEKISLSTNVQKELDGKNECVLNLQNMLKKKGELVEQLNKEIQNLKAEINGLKSIDEEKEDKIAQLISDLNDQRNYISEFQVHVEEKSRLLETLQNEMDVKKMDELKLETEKKNAIIQKLKDELAEKSHSLLELSNVLKEKEKAINRLQEQQKDRNLLVEEMKSREVDNLTFIQHLQEEINSNSEFIRRLQDSLKDKIMLAEKLESVINSKIKSINEYETELERKSSLIGLLEKELKQTSGLVHNKCAAIEELQNEIDMKEALFNKLDSDGQAKTKLLQNKISDLEKQMKSYKQQNIAIVFSSSKPEDHCKNYTSKSFSKNSEFVPEASSTHYELKAILPAEKENSVISESTLGNIYDEPPATDCQSEKEDVPKYQQLLRRLDETELCLKECKKEKSKLEKKVQKLIQNQKVLSSQNSEKPEFVLNKSDQESKNYYDACKWNLQKEILCLQAQIFKENSLYSSRHEKFMKRINDFHSLVSVSKGDNIFRELMLKLKLDVEFLENIKVLMNNIIPFVKKALKNELGFVGGQAEEVENNQNTTSEKEARESFPEKANGDKAPEKESALCSDNGAPLSRTESQTSFPSSCDSNDHHQELMNSRNCLLSDQNENAAAKDAMQLRSNYSSPDLGIESDPNQEILVPYVSDIVVAKEVSLEINGRGDHQHISKYLEGISSQGASLLVIAMLKDHELLKKQMQECMVQIKCVMSRANNGLQRINRSSTPKKLLEHTTLKSILDNCCDIEVCLNQAECLVNNFNIVSWPIEDECGYAISLLMENQDLRNKLAELQRKLQQQEKEFSKTLDQLTHEKKRKEKTDRILSKQLVETKKVLRKTKASLLGHGTNSGCSKS